MPQPWRGGCAILICAGTAGLLLFITERKFDRINTEGPVTPVNSAVPPGPISIGTETSVPPPVAPSAPPGFIFPYSGERELSRAELDNLTPRQLRLARNEIFARKGRFFNSANLKAYFDQFEWYQPHTWAPDLNAVEVRNIELIKSVEQDRQ